MWCEPKLCPTSWATRWTSLDAVLPANLNTCEKVYALGSQSLSTYAMPDAEFGRLLAGEHHGGGAGHAGVVVASQ